MAKSYLERIREQREKRIAANKAAALGERQSVLLDENLSKGVKLWWTKDPMEIRIRVLPFMVSKKNNIGDDQVGDLVNVRKYSVHFIGEKAYVCPSTYGLPCPVCDKFKSFSDAEKKDMKSPAQRFKPKHYALFNALFELADESGKTRLVMRVVNANYFATWQKILNAVKNTAATNPANDRKINLFDDPEEGYWLEAQCAKDSISGGGSEQTKFMQFTSVNLRWRENVKPLSDKVFDTITDLDLLIPEPASEDMLRRLIGETTPAPAPEETEAAEESETDLTAEDDLSVTDEIPMGEVAEANTKAYATKKTKQTAEPEAVAEEVNEEDPEVAIDDEMDDTDGFDNDDFDI